MSHPDSEEEIISYLLGDLELAARAALDDRFRAQPSFFEMAMAIEDDLLIEYVRGGHSRELRARIDTAYAETPERRARIEAARAFLDAVPRAAWARSRPWSTAWSARYSFAAAIAAATLLAIVWLPVQKHTKSLHDEADASFQLVPGRVRSGAGQQITLPPGARTIRLDLLVPDPKLFPNWRAELGTVERGEVWSGPGTARDHAVSAVIPSPALAAGDYTLKLGNSDANARKEPQAIFYFRVE